MTDKETKQEPLAQPQPVQFKCTVVDDGHPNGVPLSQWGRQPEQEPAAWVNKDGWFRSHKDADVAFRAYAFPLYAGPKKKEWIGLADDELPEGATYEFDRGVRWAEAKLKEKNT